MQTLENLGIEWWLGTNEYIANGIRDDDLVNLIKIKGIVIVRTRRFVLKKVYKEKIAFKFSEPFFDFQTKICRALRLQNDRSVKENNKTMK